MSLHRAGLMAVTTLFTAGLAPAAFAGCCTWGAAAPVAYAPPPVVYASGCGGCAPAYAPPVAVAAPISYAVATGCGGCGRAVTLVAPSPIYVVNQGPHYSGPAIMTYKTYSTGGYAGAYPYVAPLGHAYSGYDGGPYANPANYRPSSAYAPGFYEPPPARVIRRHVGPRPARVSVYHRHMAPRSVGVRVDHRGIAPRSARVSVHHRVVAPRVRVGVQPRPVPRTKYFYRDK
jgi:hypothetical protein